MHPHLPWTTKRQPLPSYCPKLDGKQHQRFSQNLHWQQGCLHYSWKHPQYKVHYMPLLYVPAMQNTTPAWSNTGHVHPSSLEQSCQGVTWYRKPIGKIKQDLSPAAIWNFKAPYLFLNRQLKGYCQEWQKYVGFLNTRETQESMQILATEAIHYTARSPPIMYDKSACWS
jgi:hypothetical protein